MHSKQNGEVGTCPLCCWKAILVWSVSRSAAAKPALKWQASGTRRLLLWHHASTEGPSVAGYRFVLSASKRIQQIGTPLPFVIDGNVYGFAPYVDGIV